MKFKEFIENVNKVLEENPESGEFEVISFTDRDCNGHNIVYFPPSIGFYDGDYNGEFDYDISPYNAVCIN
jgi:hypothetical protein